MTDVPVRVWDLDTGNEITGNDAPQILGQLERFIASGGRLAGVPLVARIVMTEDAGVVEIETEFESTSTISINRHTTIERVEFIVNGVLVGWDPTPFVLRPGDTFTITPRITMT